MKFKIAFTILMSVFINACTSLAPLPSAIQNGGTTILSLGDRIYNTERKVLHTSNFTASITDQFSNTEPVTIRMLFPITADRTSPFSEGFKANGVYLAVIDLINPNTSLPTSFSDGNASLTLNNNLGLADLNNLSFPIKILPGNGSTVAISGLGDDEQFNAFFQPDPQIRITISDPSEEITSSSRLGAISLKFSFPSAKANIIEKRYWPKVIPMASDTANLSFISSTEENAGNIILSVTILNPHGIGAVAENYYNFTDGNENAGKSSFESLEFAIVTEPRNSTITPSDISFVSSRFYNLNGEEVTPALSIGLH